MSQTLCPKPQTLKDWLFYLETLHPKTIELGLSRMQCVASRLHLSPRLKATVIMVAGTNGKGTTVAALKAIYLKAGFKVAAYTSPHLCRFNERISLNDALVSDACLCQALTVVEEGRQETPLTFFEFTTLAALWIFNQQDFDVILLEIGLGGRLDAVNYVTPDLCVLTNVELDHQQWLGNTIEEIGREKAGIFRKNTPIVYGSQHLPKSVAEQAKKLCCHLHQYGSDYDDKIAKINAQLSPESQSTAAYVAHLLLPSLPVSPQIIEHALVNLCVKGRFQRLSLSPQVIVDVAHNASAMLRLANQIEKIRQGRLILVLGILKDKLSKTLLAPFFRNTDLFCVGSIQGPRGATCDEIAEYLKNETVANFTSVNKAFEFALRKADKSDTILVTGSFHSVGPILEYYASKN